VGASSGQDPQNNLITSINVTPLVDVMLVLVVESHP
jgi:biopolymer transport protein ExbD